MTRSTLLGFLILGLALAGLAVAQFTQPEHPSYEDGAPNEAAPRTGRDGGKVADLERKVLTLEAIVDGQQTEIRSLKSALESVGTTVEPVAATGDSPVAAVRVPADLERQFAAYLDKREAEKAEKDRQARAERTAGMFLRRVDNVTADQKKAFSKVIATYFAERRNITREKYPSTEARQAATEALSADRDVKLQQIFDASQFAQVSQGFGWMDRSGGGRGGPRGNRPRR